MHVVVVGAGLGGLSAACHLAGAGHEVVIVERRGGPGGVATTFDAGGFRIDAGPSVVTMPEILAATFGAAGAAMEDHVTLRPVDPMYRACFPDGSELRVRHGLEPMRAEVAAFAGVREADAFVRFCAWLRDLAAVEIPGFIDRNFDSPVDLVREPLAALTLVRLGAFRRLAHRVAAFFDDPRLQQVFSFQSLYAGLSPFEALAVYCVITYMDTVEGVFFPDGGVHAVATGLERAARAAGVEVRYDTEVERVVRGADGRVTGIRTVGGEEITAGAVVVNADVAATYRTLLGIDAPRVVRRGTYSPSCALWLAGMRGALPDAAAHHNIHFGGEWRDAFDALLRRGVRMPDPSILITSPTHSDPGLAPEGGTALYVLEPTPNLDGHIDWDRDGEQLRDDLRARVGALGYPTADVVVEQFTDPRDWRAQGLERGTPFSLAHRFFQTGPFRPRNVDARVPGLVLVGMGTVPGVGIPMVLLSGRLAAARVEAIAAS